MARHGSCGMGIGETARFALANPGEAPRVGDCAAPRTLERKLTRLRDALAAVALRYAVEAAGGVDAVALTHLDTVARTGSGWAARTRLTGTGWIA